MLVRFIALLALAVACAVTEVPAFIGLLVALVLVEWG